MLSLRVAYLLVQIHAAFVPAFERMISQYGGTSNGGMAFDPVTRQLLIYPLGNLSAHPALSRPSQ